MEEMKFEEKILQMIRDESENNSIPDSLHPESIRRKLQERKKHRTYVKALVAAAAICIGIGCTSMAAKFGYFSLNNKQDEICTFEVTETSRGFRTVTYEEVYAAIDKVWEEEKKYRTMYDVVLEGEPAEDVAESVGENSAFGELSADSSMIQMEEPASDGDDFGSTNVQTAGVDEGDIVKNDGRYLYQLIDTFPNQSIQIIDTQDGLKEVSKFGEFESIAEFYVWNDLLIIIENKYMVQTFGDTAESVRIDSHDMMYRDNCYHQISIYSIADRSMPKEQKVFTLQGEYRSSRISEGYFYSFSKYYASPGDGEEDYDAYIPHVDGEKIREDCIVLPKDCKGTSYLVMTSIDLNNPSEFTDTIGILSDSERYYVSSNHIYVTYSAYDWDLTEQEGWNVNETKILRFGYENGKITLGAEGSIYGSLNDTFSMDEFDNHLRVVTTVNEYYRKPIKDDRTQEIIGFDVVDERQTNALYVLDNSLNVVGKIEGLAENEWIYSARFFGNIGYFVTFRQMDPLFAVDLSDPKNPKVLSELKVSGFSEYLHFYGENRLFGLGMEADEETGRQEGIKLSMFDITDPANVQEITREHLKEYYYSDALYNHHAILIHPSANIIGFSAEGNRDDEYIQNYLVFAYENDTFVKRMEISTKLEDGGYYYNRGTFIGDVFYLLSGNGTVKSYDLNTGALLEVLAD